MLLTLIGKDRIFSSALPAKASGQYWISDRGGDGQIRNVARAEGRQGTWHLCGSELLGLLDDQGHEAESIELSSSVQVIPAVYRGTGEKVQLFVEPATADRKIFKKYLVTEGCRLNIGRAADNHIIFETPYVSAHHACLVYEKGRWSITDTQSSNGTFLNNRRIATASFQPGDIVYIMGLKVIAGAGFFAINSPDGGVRVNAPAVQKLIPQEKDTAEELYEKTVSGESFYRSPRMCRSIVEEEIRVDEPPNPPDMEKTPLALIMGPAVTMGITSVVMGAVAVINLASGESKLLSTLPALVMAFSMLCGTLLWPTLTRKNDAKRKKAAEKERQEKYRSYLDHIRNRLFAISVQQKEILLENSPDLADCQKRILERQSGLWERTSSHEDFLSLRLGLGTLPLKVRLNYSEKRFSLDEDNLINEFYRFSEAPLTLENVPIPCPLREKRVVGIIGDEREVARFAKGLVLQIVSLHSYDEVKLAMLSDEQSEADWNFIRLMPHIWSNNRDVRYLAVNEDEAKALLAILEQELAARVGAQGKQGIRCSPHYVLIAANMKAAGQTEMFSRIASAPAEAGFFCIVLARQLRDLPKECSLVAELSNGSATLYDPNDTSGQRQQFQPEYPDEINLAQSAQSLANLDLEEEQGQSALPNMLTFLELYNVGKVEHLNALSRWKENNPIHTLQVPVGVGVDGEPFYLDLHEKFQGPHGLVAGMTGSGKSEFIITMILSLAVNYHPDEVAFILIDYKGGGLAGAFENVEKGVRLPHLAGTITNLDGAAVKRSLISIQSELRRRQAVFNVARDISGEGTIDIYKYQKMYRSGAVKEPVPHLFIISDEFAELKSQQPEFMTQLISAARIGRSLGVHLILATQKPSGVVDDQIWSNSRFRICLKVQERADSMEMIKCPDAAALKETGRFYLQVGYQEFFALGQSAWCGAPYVPSERVEKGRDNGIAVLDNLGRILAEERPSIWRNSENASTEVVSIVQYLSNLAAEEHLKTRQLWMPAIPGKIYWDELREKYNWAGKPMELTAVIGEYDDPARQAQYLLTMPFSQDGHAVLFGTAGAGKATFLNTLLYGLLSDYSAKYLNVYLVDLGEETLGAFSEAPQVGDVLYFNDTEKLANLFKMLQKEVTARKKQFSEDDGDYLAYCRRTGESIPYILVVIRNYAAFSEQFDLLENQLVQLTRECGKYGIYFLLTADAVNAVRYRVLRNFAQILTLQLSDLSDYATIWGNTGGMYPSKMKGRGIFRAGQIYEFQIAHFAREYGQTAIRSFVKELRQKDPCKASPVPVLPERVTWEMFSDEATPEAFPIGVDKVSLRPIFVNLSGRVVTLLLAQDTYEMAATAQGIAELLAHTSEAAVTVLDGGKVFKEPDDVAYSYLSKDFEPRVVALFQEMVCRHNSYKQARESETELPEFAQEFYIITGLQELLTELSEDGQDKLKVLIWKAVAEFRIHFIMCDSASSINAHTGENWYRTHISGRDGIWAGDGISSQYLLKLGNITSDLYTELPPHFGYVVQRGKPVLTKLLVTVQEETEL